MRLEFWSLHGLRRVRAASHRKMRRLVPRACERMCVKRAPATTGAALALTTDSMRFSAATTGAALALTTDSMRFSVFSPGSDKCMWSSLACAKCGPCSPLGYPTWVAPPMLSVTSGDTYCSIDSSGCVTDGRGIYDNDEACTVKANQDITVSATFFELEQGWDTITIGTNEYSGDTGPSNVAMAAGSTMTWYTDNSEVREGFVICPTAV